MEKLEIAKHLRKAAEVMIAGGIARGTRYNERGAHCALGAIGTAFTGKQRESNSHPEIEAALSRMLPKKVGPDPYNCRDHEPSATCHAARVATWSHNLCATAEDVACVMRATAELLEEEAKVGPDA